MAVERLRTTDEVVETLNSFFDTNVPNVLRQEGTVPQDLIDTFSIEFGNLYTITTFVKEASTVPGLRRLISDDSDSVSFREDLATALNKTTDEINDLISRVVDDKAADENLTRKPATSATLVLRFFTTSSFNASIPVGTAARTPGLNSIEYKTTINILNQPPTLDPISGLYYIDVQAQATLPGISSRVPLNRVTDLTPPLTGFSTVTNITSSSGGTDVETDSELLDRILLARRGRELDTIIGLQLFAESQPGVQDALVIDNSDPLLTRGIGNQVDILIMGSNNITVTDTITYNSLTMQGEVVLPKQPVDTITALTVSGIPKTQGVHFNFIKDTGGLSGSVRGQDKIVFTFGNIPLDGEPVLIQYTINQLIADLQTLISSSNENEIPNSDILIREAIDLLIDIRIHITKFPEFSTTEVESSITSGIQSFFDEKLLGQSIFQSDLVRIIEDTSGVDRVDIPFQRLAITPNVGTSDITVEKNQFARLNSLIFV